MTTGHGLECVRVCACERERERIHIYTYTICTHTYIHTCTYTCIYVCVCVWGGRVICSFLFTLKRKRPKARLGSLRLCGAEGGGRQACPGPLPGSFPRDALSQLKCGTFVVSAKPPGRTRQGAKFSQLPGRRGIGCLVPMCRPPAWGEAEPPVTNE